MINKCYYCGIKSKKIAASGLWYCPNVWCEGPGATWFRAKLKSYKQINSYEYIVDEKELEEARKKFSRK